MGPMQRAEAIITRARSRGSAVVCPGDAPSPMDADITLVVPQSVIAGCERRSQGLLSGG